MWKFKADLYDLDLFGPILFVPSPKSIDGQGIKFVLKFWSSLTDLNQHELTTFAPVLPIFCQCGWKSAKKRIISTHFFVLGDPIRFVDPDTVALSIFFPKQFWSRIRKKLVSPNNFEHDQKLLFTSNFCFFSHVQKVLIQSKTIWTF